MNDFAPHRDGGGADGLADVARSGVQHDPHRTRLIEADLDEVVAAAQRTELRPHPRVVVLADAAQDAELFIARLQLGAHRHQGLDG
jgi:hypothetical protein